MRAHICLTAAFLIPLLVFGPSCARSSRQVRLQSAKDEVLVTPQAAPPVDVSEAGFKQAMARLSRDAELVAFFSHPKATRLHLVPAAFATDDAFVSGYQHLCATRGKPPDCLDLLRDRLFDADDRQAVATSIAFHSILAGVAQELGRSVDPDQVYARVASAMVGFMALLAFPDPITKILLGALALTAIAYIGWDTFYSIREGWSALKHRCASATAFADLKDAGQRFGTIVGENVGRIVVMLVVAAMGASLGSFTARLSSLPGVARAAQMFQLRLGLSFGTVTAGQATAVTISASGVTVALVPAVAMSSASNSGQSSGQGSHDQMVGPSVGSGSASQLKWGNPRSAPTYGHTFLDHTSKLTRAQLVDRARSLGHQVGQWTDDVSGAEFIAGVARRGPGVHDVPLPRGLGRSFLADGRELQADMARIVVKPNGGIRTAFPFNSAQPN